MELSSVHAHPLPRRVLTGSSVQAAAHWSSSRAPLADPAPHSRILQRAVLCCAMLCCAVPLTSSIPSGVDSRSRLPLWPIHFPLIAPWATIISAGPERTINPPLAPAKRLVPIFHQVGTRQPASARSSTREAKSLHFTLCLFFLFVFCVRAATLTASNPSLFFFSPLPGAVPRCNPPKPIRHPSGLRSGSARRQSFPLVSCSVVSAQSPAPSNPTCRRSKSPSPSNPFPSNQEASLNW